MAPVPNEMKLIGSYLMLRTYGMVVVPSLDASPVSPRPRAKQDPSWQRAMATCRVRLSSPAMVPDDG